MLSGLRSGGGGSREVALRKDKTKMSLSPINRGAATLQCRVQACWPRGITRTEHRRSRISTGTSFHKRRTWNYREIRAGINDNESPRCIKIESSETEERSRTESNRKFPRRPRLLGLGYGKELFPGAALSSAWQSFTVNAPNRIH